MKDKLFSDKKSVSFAVFTSDYPLKGDDNIRLIGKSGLYFAEGDAAALRRFFQLNGIAEYRMHLLSRNQGVPLIDYEAINARIEPGAVIRESAKIHDGAIVLMNAVVNVHAEIGAGTMIDMGAVIGSHARIGKNCHIGANAVIAGALEPPSKSGVVIEDSCFIGANAVVLEGVRIGEGSVIGALTLVREDVPPHSVVMGVPGRVVKPTDEKTKEKCSLNDSLRD